MKRIHDSLDRVFQNHRLVFWYDPAGEWTEAFEAFPEEGVTKLTVNGNEFGTKVRVARDPDPDARFLIYVPSVRPADADNWLLDLLLQGYEYKADKASLALQDAGLPHEFLPLVQEHEAFFNDAGRVRALKERIAPEDQNREIRLKMMAVLANTTVETDALLLRFLDQGGEEELIEADAVSECLGTAKLVPYFWAEIKRLFGYTSAEPSLRDFAVTLFRGTNPLDTTRAAPPHPHGKVFLQRWKDSQACRDSFLRWSQRMERDLGIAEALDKLDERTPLGEWDTFEVTERLIIHRLCQAFLRGAAAADLRAVMQQRKASFWRERHGHGYAALEQAVELRELLDAADIRMDSARTGFSRYTARWWRIDTAYRLCTWNLRQYGQVQVMEKVSRWVEKTYVNNFLLPLADRWSDQVRGMDRWECPGIHGQARFFEHYVRPFLTKGQKVFVIISDALRYEAAADFARRINQANRWTAEVEAVLGVLPSYTQLGMAALLPGRQRTVDPVTQKVSVDGRSAAGTDNRAETLSLACDGKATGIQADAFLEMNTKTDGRTMMRDNAVIYIFHNVIDKAGDSAVTEAKTFDAVELAFHELELIIKKVANINGSNMLLTADHGFLFQQDEVAPEDAALLPAAAEWTSRNRRFAIGREIVPDPRVKVFDSAALELGDGWSVAFPLSLGRFPLKGSGKRYVHGGVSLQEVAVPVVKIHKARADDTGRVEVELLHVPPRITTGTVSIRFFQDRPALDKVLPRTLRAGVFALDGTVLSEIKSLTFDSGETEPRNREFSLLLVLSGTADAFNNQEVEFRLEETLPGTSQTVVYKTQRLRLQKPFASDFDEF